MYETSQNQGYYPLISDNWKCSPNSQRFRYFQMDSSKMGQKVKECLWEILLQRTSEKINQASPNPYQINSKREGRYYQSFKYYSSRCQKDQISTQIRLIINDCTQTVKKDGINIAKTKLQKTSFPEWISYET